MNDKIIEAIYTAIDEVNIHLDNKLERSPSEVISDKLDSLATINFIVAVEQSISNIFGKQISLTNEKALQADPLKSVESLSYFIQTLLEE